MFSADWSDTNCSLADEVNVFIIDDLIMILMLLQRLLFIDLLYWSTLSLHYGQKNIYSSILFLVKINKLLLQGSGRI